MVLPLPQAPLPVLLRVVLQCAMLLVLPPTERHAEAEDVCRQVRERGREGGRAQLHNEQSIQLVNRMVQWVQSVPSVWSPSPELGAVLMATCVMPGAGA